MYIHVNKTINREIFLKCIMLFFMCLWRKNAENTSLYVNYLLSCTFEPLVVKFVFLNIFWQNNQLLHILTAYFWLTWAESSSEIFWSPFALRLFVRPRVRPSVNFSHFNILPQNHWANITQTWHFKYPWVRGIQVCSNERSNLFPRGDNNE